LCRVGVVHRDFPPADASFSLAATNDGGSVRVLASALSWGVFSYVHGAPGAAVPGPSAILRVEPRVRARELAERHRDGETLGSANGAAVSLPALLLTSRTGTHLVWMTATAQARLSAASESASPATWIRNA
jgi:hypothetical protein